MRHEFNIKLKGVMWRSLITSLSLYKILILDKLLNLLEPQFSTLHSGYEKGIFHVGLSWGINGRWFWEISTMLDTKQVSIKYLQSYVCFSQVQHIFFSVCKLNTSYLNKIAVAFIKFSLEARESITCILCNICRLCPSVLFHVHLTWVTAL